jgi:para-nitrobenzyl esterase
MKQNVLGRRIAGLILLSLCLGLSTTSVLMKTQRARSARSRGAQQLSDPVMIEQGLIRGEVLGSTVAFRGIPYAAPPVGQLRWRSPQSPQPWTDVRNTVQFGNRCPQFARADGSIVLPGQPDVFAGNEDCLTLNIWGPKDRGPSLRPVMVFIHGGGNVQGSAVLPTYDGRSLAEAGGVVVVTINYRLGQFGFLAHPLLSAEDQGHQSSGNYGLLDQIFALQWVQRNIRNLGGDPGNVTIFGESAGGVNVSCLVSSPLGAGLFHRAVVESGGFIVNERLRDLPGAPQAESAEEFGLRFAKEIGCDSAADPLACMRSKSAEQVLNTLKAGPALLSRFEGDVTYGPNVDGYVLTDSPLNVMRAGRHNNVPIIIGTNKNEGTIFITNIPLGSEAAYRNAVRRFFPPTISAQVLARYPASDYDSPRDALDAIISDVAFICPARLTSGVLAANRSRVYVYHFTHTMNSLFLRSFGAFHGLELMFIFDTFGIFRTTANEEALSDSIQTYWTNFAKNGDPNGGGLAAWPVYTSEGDKHLNLDVSINTGTALRKEYCDFWAQLLMVDAPR